MPATIDNTSPTTPNTTGSYTFKSIASPAEVEAFLDHLGIVFGVPKANGAPGACRGVFQDHWENDPDADKDGVVVAIPTGSNEIVSSVRVYVRQIHITPTTSVRIGGIGDVATRIEHRGKRLASKLMTMADDYMTSHGFPFGMLHAAPAAAPLYASLGWHSCPATYNVIKFMPEDWTSSSSLLNIIQHGSLISSKPRKVNFGSELDVSIMMKLHQMVAGPVSGSFERPTIEHWTRWVPSSRDIRRRFERVVLANEGDVRVGDEVGYIIVEGMVADLNAILATTDATEKATTKEITIQIREVFAGKVDAVGVSISGSTVVTSISPLSPERFAVVLSNLFKSGIEALGLSAEKVTVLGDVPAASLPFEAMDSMLATPTATNAKLNWLNKDRRDVSVDNAMMFKLFKPFTVKDANGEDVEVGDIEALIKIFRSPLGKFTGCEGVNADQTEGFGFFKTDNF
ncbi:hypothetical protein HDU76_000970 [Blyttiomyces sp. JEL0837]|nr:hypothetical protein HDU76_000970 [Blyttiomyces sp. JEL0837]